MFQGQVVSLREAIQWPPRSPDLNLFGGISRRKFSKTSSVLESIKGCRSRKGRYFFKYAEEIDVKLQKQLQMYKEMNNKIFN